MYHQADFSQMNTEAMISIQTSGQERENMDEQTMNRQAGVLWMDGWPARWLHRSKTCRNTNGQVDRQAMQSKLGHVGKC